MYRIVTVVCAAAVGLGLLMFDDSLIPVGDEPVADFSGSSEARQWLRDNEGESALASNRFGRTSGAIRFVNELYRAGAVRVVVPEEAIEDDGVEVYADSLVVIMPSDPEKRRRVRTICDREIRREGIDPREDGDADQVYLWWD